MTALDAYKNLLIELDKWESPVASIKDFNYFFMASVHEVADLKHAKGPDGMQFDHDDIKDLLSDPTDISFGSGLTADLPSDYRNLLDLKLILKFTSAKSKYKKDDTIESHPRKERSSRYGYVEGNSYQQAKLKRSWYRLNKNKITVVIDPATVVKEAQLVFYEQPKLVYLHPDYATLSVVEKAKEENNTTLQFSDHTVAKIVKVCRRKMLENIESGRYNTVLNENNLTIT